MSVPLRPLADMLVAVKEESQTKTASGFILPESAKEKSSAATVKAIGPEVKGVKVGDKIVYKEYSTTELKVDNVKYLLVKEEDVLAVLA